MRTLAPGRQSEGTWPAGRARRGYIDTGDLPMQTVSQSLLAQSDQRPARPAQTEVMPRATPAEPGPVDPRITVAIVVSTGSPTPGRWEDVVRSVREALDIAGAARTEAFTSGAQGSRSVIWYAEVSGGKAAELRADLAYYAGYWRHFANVTWAPCSPVPLR